MKALILAGGLGMRLRPFTSVIPKPLMPVGDQAIIEILIRQLKQAKVDEIYISVGYGEGYVRAFLGDGSRLGVHITYLSENERLGTVGPLSHFKEKPENLIVLNGDILTDLNFSSFISFAEHQEADLTIAAYSKPFPINLGVLEVEGTSVTDYIEKPTRHVLVSMGAYICKKTVYQLIPRGYYDLPSLALDLIGGKGAVAHYQHSGFWLDIGNTNDFELAQESVDELLPRILSNE